MGIFQRSMNLFRRSKLDSEIAAELQSHIELRAEENMAHGMTPEDALREARMRFGNPTSTREGVASADALLAVESVLRDVRYAFRQLRRSPGFAVTAILTLALGIGANVVVFGVLNGLLLQPMRVPNASRLYEVVNADKGDDNQCYPDFVDYRARQHAFTDLAAYRLGITGFSVGGSAFRSWEYAVSGNYFDMLGVQPQLGRFFHESHEHGPNSAPFIVLSDSMWRTRFSADPRVIGTVVELNKHPFTILGVAPRSFNGTEIFFWPEFWMPMVNEEQVEGYSYLTKRGNHGLYVIGELRASVTPAQAVEDLDGIARQLAKENPATDSGRGIRLVKPGLMGDVLGGPAKPFLTALMALALLVLIAACVNLAGVFAARAADRSRELAIRISIGSTRARILRQVLTEAFVLAAAGGAVGTGIAAGLLALLSRWQPIAAFPIHVIVDADARVYAAAFVLSLASGLLPGLLPARQVWRTDAMQAIKSNAAGQPKIARLTIRDLLLGVQIAVCALLVTASLVACRGMQRSLTAPFGFDPQNATLLQVDMKMAGYSDDTAYPVQRRILEEAARLPGIKAVGSVSSQPLSGSGDNWSVYREGTPDFKPSTAVMSAHAYTISPGYLRAAQTRLLEGRDFSWSDGPNAPKVAIVNQTFARRLFGADPALGRHFLGGDKVSYQIVGIVEDGKYEVLTEDQAPAEFIPLPQSHEANMTLVVRSPMASSEVAAPLNRLVSGVDSSLPYTIQSWIGAMGLVLFPARVATAALGVMGLLAAMLAITGIFGMAAYSVAKRMRELGIRVALGASGARVMRSALGKPLLVLSAGSFAGLVLGVLTSRLLASIVFEATPRDPLVLVSTVLSMAFLGLLATWIPAQRALRINPARLLREE